MLLKDKRIFVVEDNLQNRVVFKITLQMQGAWVDFERWGEGAVKRLQAFGAADLIILDLMLAGDASGYECFQQIRRLPQYQLTPIIAVSAAEPAIAIPMTQELGFDGFIAKPIDADRFPKQVARVIAGEKLWSAYEPLSDTN